MHHTPASVSQRELVKKLRITTRYIAWSVWSRLFGEDCPQIVCGKDCPHTHTHTHTLTHTHTHTHTRGW
jgi:hypothetical protein